MTEQDKPKESLVIQGKEENFEAKNAITLKEAEESGFIPATDIVGFANTIVGWHTNIVNQGNHLLGLDNSNPDDPMKIVINVHEPAHPEADPETGYRALTDAELVPFKHGARWLLNLVEDLPFNYVPTDADEKPLPGYGNSEAADQE